MKDVIVVATSPGREDWAKDCSESIKKPHIIVSYYGYELGKIKWFYEKTNFDRIIFLQDSVVIKDPGIFDRIKDTAGSICLHHERQHMSCYLGVYERSVLAEMDIPVIRTKNEAVDNEWGWVESYLQKTEVTCFDYNANGNFGAVETRHGRDNLIYSNDFLIKYRGDFGQGAYRGEDPVEC